jgi:hypothetical protein
MGGPTWAAWHFSETFGCPDFVQFGPNYGGARDACVCGFLRKQRRTHLRPTSMARFRRSENARRVLRGRRSGRDATWDRDLAARKPIFRDQRGTQHLADRNAGLTLHPHQGEGPHTLAWRLMLRNRGAVTTVYYDDHRFGNDRTYHHKFPPKWMSVDGRTMWLLFSGLGGGNYAFCLRRAVVEPSEGAGGWVSLFDPKPRVACRGSAGRPREGVLERARRTHHL